MYTLKKKMLILKSMNPKIDIYNLYGFSFPLDLKELVIKEQ